jgi:hypothetical protein
VIEAFKTAQRERLVQLCAAAALAEPEMLADELFLLLEGARVAAQSMGPKGLGRDGEQRIRAANTHSRISLNLPEFVAAPGRRAQNRPAAYLRPLIVQKTTVHFPNLKFL